MHRTTVFLDADLEARLTETARQEQRPRAEIVREALRVYLDGRARPRPRSIGIAEGLRRGETSETIKARIREEWSRRTSSC